MFLFKLTKRVEKHWDIAGEERLCFMMQYHEQKTKKKKNYNLRAAAAIGGRLEGCFQTIWSQSFSSEND